MISKLWLLHCGCYIVVATLWLLHCGCYIMIATLWLTHCGCCIVVVILWLLHCGCYIVVDSAFNGPVHSPLHLTLSYHMHWLNATPTSVYSGNIFNVVPNSHNAHHHQHENILNGNISDISTYNIC